LHAKEKRSVSFRLTDWGTKRTLALRSPLYVAAAASPLLSKRLSAFCPLAGSVLCDFPFNTSDLLNLKTPDLMALPSLYPVTLSADILVEKLTSSGQFIDSRDSLGSTAFSARRERPGAGETLP
jgi:hypothetical protein